MLASDTNRRPAAAQPAAERSRASALAVRAPTAQMAARAQSYLWAFAGVLITIVLALPHPAEYYDSGLAVIVGCTFVTAAALYASRDRMPMWVPATGSVMGIALTALSVTFTASGFSPASLFFLWVGFYAFYFLRRETAVAIGVLAAIAAAASAAYMGSGDGTFRDAWVPSTVFGLGTLLLVGVFIVTLQDRVGTLIERLTEAATTDQLTGLRNRRGFRDALELEIARAERSEGSFSLLLADCDLFKHVNDSMGHGAGDRTLAAIGALLEEHRRKIDVAARVGGEEFAIVLPDTEEHEAFLVAERLRMRVAELFAESPVALTMSMGVAAYPKHADTVDGLMSAADDALYAAKAMGRDRSVLHSHEIAGILSQGRHGTESRAEAQLATVLNLAEALDMRDTGTAQHSQTVGRYAEMMARRLGFQPSRVERMRIAGVLHDIGKIGVADSILQKPGKLTDIEYEAMKKHPEIGARILGGSELDDIRRWVLAHHERPDGRGYPEGLQGAQICIEARILAVADAYEAMTSDRVYRNSMGAEAARAELLRCAGTQFDPEIVRTFLAALDAGLERRGAGSPPA